MRNAFIGLTAPTPTQVVSRKVHGSAGTFDLTLAATPLNPTAEPRQGPAHSIVFTFDKPVTGATAAITQGTATAAAPTFNGNIVIIGLTAAANHQYVTIALTNVASADGGTGGSWSVRMGFLLGDVNRSRVVSVADLGSRQRAAVAIGDRGQFPERRERKRDADGGGQGHHQPKLTKALPPP